MDPIIVSALITVMGMLGVAIVSAVVQVRVTKHVVDAEHRKVIRQLAAEATIRAHESRRDRLHVALAEMVRRTDPELFRRDPDVEALTRSVHEVQLLLLRDRPLEGAVNAAVNRLALELSGWGSGPGDLESGMALHSELVDQSQRLLAALDAPVSVRSGGHTSL